MSEACWHGYQGDAAYWMAIALSQYTPTVVAAANS